MYVSAPHVCLVQAEVKSEGSVVSDPLDLELESYELP